MKTYDGVPVKIVNWNERGKGRCPETYQLLKDALKS